MRQPRKSARGGPRDPTRTPPAAPRARAATDQRKRPTQARSRALVDALVEATARVVATEGTAAVTTTRVAEVAGVSVGSLYQYFPTRESLIAAVIEDRARRDEARLAALLASLEGAPLEAALRRLAELAVAMFRESPRLYREMVEAMGAVEREQVVDAMVQRCAALTRHVLEPHRGRLARDAELATYVISTAIVAVLRDAAKRRPELYQGEALVEELHALMARYLID